MWQSMGPLEMAMSSSSATTGDIYQSKSHYHHRSAGAKRECRRLSNPSNSVDKRTASTAAVTMSPTSRGLGPVDCGNIRRRPSAPTTYGFQAQKPPATPQYRHG